MPRDAAPKFKYRNNTALATIASLAVFILWVSVVLLIVVKNSALPWWRSAPEQWVYPLQDGIERGWWRADCGD